MARLFFTGLEAGSLDVFSAIAPILQGTLSVSNVAPRTGSYHLSAYANNVAAGHAAWSRATFAAIGEVYLRTFFRMVGFGAQRPEFIRIIDNIGTVHLSVAVNAVSGRIELYRGYSQSGTVLATSVNALNIGQYYEVEVRATIADAGGICEVRVDGVTEINFVGDTRNAGNANIGECDFGIGWIGGQSVNTTWYHDDIVINDIAGTVNNSWPGNSAIYGLLPTGAGNYSNLTRGGVDSGANWSQVNETPPDDDTEYVYDTIVDEEDTYVMGNLPVSGDVAALQWLCRAKQDVAGPDAIARMFRMGGVDYQGADLPLTVAYAYYQEILETNPATGFAWAISEVDAMEAGVKTR